MREPARRDGRSRRAFARRVRIALGAAVVVAAPPAGAVVEWRGEHPAYTVDARVDVRRAVIDERVEFSLRISRSDRASWGDVLHVRWPDSTEVQPVLDSSGWRVDGRVVASHAVTGGLALEWPPADDSSPSESLDVRVEGRVRFRVLPCMRFRDGPRRGLLLDEWFPTIATPRRDGAVDVRATRVARHRLRLTVSSRAGVVASGLTPALPPDAPAAPGAWHTCEWQIDSVPMATVVVAEGLVLDEGGGIVIAGVPAVRDPAALRLAAGRALDACAALYGPPPVTPLSVVVIPHALDADAATGPGLIILRGRGAADGPARGALQHEVAHLWWGTAMAADVDVAWFFEGIASYTRELAWLCAGGARSRDRGGSLWERLEGEAAVFGWRALVRAGGDRPLRGISAATGDAASVVLAYGKSLAFCRAVGDSIGAQAFALALRGLYASVRGRTLEEADLLAAVTRAESLGGRTAAARDWITASSARPAPRSRARVVFSPPSVDYVGNVVTGVGVSALTPWSPWRGSAGVALSSAGAIPGWTARIAREWGAALARVERTASTGRTEWIASMTARTRSPDMIVTAAAARRDDRSTDAARAWQAGRTDRLRIDLRLARAREGGAETDLRAHGEVIAPRGVGWSILAARAGAIGGMHVALALDVRAVGGTPLVQDLPDAFRLGLLRGRGPGRVPSRGIGAVAVRVRPGFLRPLHAYAALARLHGAIDAHGGVLAPIARDPTVAEAGIGVSVGFVDALPRLTLDAPLWMTGRLPGARVRVQVAAGGAGGLPRTPLLVVR